MPGITRKTVDEAGGPLLDGSPNVFVNGHSAVRIGDPVQPHARKGGHRDATMAEGSSTVFVNGIPVSRKTDAATCGHLATGSNDVIAG